MPFLAFVSVKKGRKVAESPGRWAMCREWILNRRSERSKGPTTTQQGMIVIASDQKPTNEQASFAPRTLARAAEAWQTGAAPLPSDKSPSMKREKGKCARLCRGTSDTVWELYLTRAQHQDPRGQIDAATNFEWQGQSFQNLGTELGRSEVVSGEGRSVAGVGSGGRMNRRWMSDVGRWR